MQQLRGSMTSSGNILTRTRLHLSISNYRACNESLELARSLLNATMTKIEQANAANSLSDTSRQAEFQVLDAPTVPTRPAATLARLLEYIALGVAASLAFLLCVIAFATWQDTTIRNGDDLERVTSVPLLEAIPHLPGSQGTGGGRPQPAGGSA